MKVVFNKIQRYYGSLDGYIPLHERISILCSYFLGAVIGDIIPREHLFYLGGLNHYERKVYPFLGLNFIELSGENIQVAMLGFQFEPWKNIFIVLKGNLAKTEKDFSELFILNKDLIYGYGITLGWGSPIGPVECTLMQGEDWKNVLFHVNIGFKF